MIAFQSSNIPFPKIVSSIKVDIGFLSLFSNQRKIFDNLLVDLV